MTLNEELRNWITDNIQDFAQDTYEHPIEQDDMENYYVIVGKLEYFGNDGNTKYVYIVKNVEGDTLTIEECSPMRVFRDRTIKETFKRLSVGTVVNRVGEDFLSMPYENKELEFTIVLPTLKIQITDTL